jgi:hypothetical protein
MNDAVRPSSFFSGAVPASAPSGVQATVPNPPPEVARLPAGTTLRGVVIGEDGKGHVLVKTDLGTLAVATKAHPAKDSEVILQVRSTGAQLHVMIMQTRAPLPAAQPPAQAPLPPLPGQDNAAHLDPYAPQPTGREGAGRAVPSGLAAAPYGPAELRGQAQLIRAIVQAAVNPQVAGSGTTQPAGQALPPSPVPATALPAALLNLTPGTVLRLHIMAVNAPTPALPAGPGTAGNIPGLAGASPAPFTGAPAESTPGGGVPASLATGAPASAVPNSALPGSALPGQGPQGAGLRPVSFATSLFGQGPPGPGLSGATTPGPVTFTGLVTSVTHAGHPVLSTPLGILTLEIEAQLPVGSQVTLELPASGLKRAVEAHPGLARTGFGHAWPALQEALTILGAPAAGQPAAVPPAVPQPGQRLASGILFFLAALSGGDLGRWLGGEALQALRAAGRDSLIGRIGRDLAQMGRMSEATGSSGGGGAPVGEWRLLPIPLWDGDQLRQIRLFLRQREARRDKDKSGGRKDPTRFILELEMSRLGEMQLDGLVREKRFDLLLRTRQALSERMRRDIRAIFDGANETAGYSGNVGFQASADWHMLPLNEDALAGPAHGLVV